MKIHTLFTNESRTVNKDGKQFLVVPGVPVQEQVMNTYLLPSIEIEKQLLAWNGTPVSIRHAQENGGSVKVPNPDVPIIGYFYNTKWDPATKRMLGEYWIDEGQALQYPDGQTIVNAIKNGQILETSTAYWADEDMAGGTFNGRKYKTVHRNLKPDHIAIFPDDQSGACSVHDGCGVNRNMKHNCDQCIHKNYESIPEYEEGYLPTAMLIGYAMNKGSRTKEEMDSMRSMVKEHGITKPVWVQCNGSYKILDGNHRVYLAEEFGIEQIPVRTVNTQLENVDTEAVYRKWLHEQDQGYLK